LEEDGARGARHALHGGGAHDAVLLVAAERERHRRPAARQQLGPQLLPEDERVLDGHAAALPQVGHHGVHGVAEQADVAVGPLELGRAVEEVALLDLVEGRAAQQLLHLGAPPLELVSQEVDLRLATVE
jgi:hypothetical protein